MVDELVTYMRVELIQKIEGSVSKVVDRLLDKVQNLSVTFEMYSTKIC